MKFKLNNIKFYQHKLILKFDINTSLNPNSSYKQYKIHIKSNNI